VQLEHFYTSHNHQHVKQLTRALHDNMLRFGYESVDTPVIEFAELFLTKAGDQLITRLFTFDRLGQQFALRPEFTALAVHRYVANALDGVVRWQFSGPIFADDQQVHSYQQFSVGAELIGMSGPAADSEILAMAALGIAAQDYEDWQLIVGHVGLMRQLLKCFQLDERTERFLLSHRSSLKDPALGKAYIMQRLDKLLLQSSEMIDLMGGPTVDGLEPANRAQHILDVLLDTNRHGHIMGGRTREDITRRLLQKQRRSAERDQITAAVDFLDRWVSIDTLPDKAFRDIEALVETLGQDSIAHTILAEWQETIALMSAYDIPLDKIRIQPELARSWDYYTGIVFELQTQSAKHLGGGGRYDELVHLIGGKGHVPAVGFAYYVDTLLEVLPQIPMVSALNICIKVAPGAQQAGAVWAQRLRQNNLSVSILPVDRPDNGKITLLAQEDGSLRFGTVDYGLDQAEALLEKLAGGEN
jgi:ATP phosphoribosyltransferase regulatory subunit